MSFWQKLFGKASSHPAAETLQARQVASPASRDGGTLLRATPAARLATPAVTAAQEPDAGHKIAGIFPVKKVLGAGSMGTVYLVQHPSWNIEVALKVAKAELVADADNRHRITVEAEAWTELGLHPFIAYCYYVQSVDDVLLLVVEYLDGGNLQEWIGRHGQGADLRSKLDLALQFCHGLEHAHAHGMIHRDIKPSNVLLSKDGLLKITDFGIARICADSARGGAPVPGAPIDGTIAGIGTEDYMPPEQWESAQVDPRADLFAFGVCLYEMCCGRRPYAGRLIGPRLQPLDPARLNPALPPALSELMRQCVAWDREERPATALAIREQLCAIYEQQFGESSLYAELPPYSIAAAALNNRALSYIELGKPELAEQAWQAALESDVSHIETIYNYGLHEWRAARLNDDALIRQLENASVDRTGDWLPAYLQAEVYLESGDADNVRRCLDAIGREDAERAEVVKARRDADSLRASGVERTLYPRIHGANSSVCLSTDGRFALSASKQYRGIQLWETASGVCLREYSGENCTLSMCLSADSRFALLGGVQSLQLWDLGNGECLRTFRGHRRAVQSVCLSADGRFALSGSTDQTLKLWDLGNAECLRTFRGHTQTVKSVCLSADGRFTLSGSTDQTLKLWDLGSGECLQTFSGHTECVNSVCLSADGRFALSGSGDKTLKLWNVGSGECLRTFSGHTECVNSVCLSTDGRFALSGSGDKTLKLWDVGTGKCQRTVSGHPDGVLSVCLSVDGRLALSGGEEHTLKLWDLTNGECVRAFSGHTDLLWSFCVSADGRFALSGSRDKTLMLWDVGSGKCLRTFSGHTECVNSVCLSADGRFALSGSEEDKTLKLWDVGSGACLRTFSGHTGGVSSVCLSADGRFALSGSDDHTLKLWDVGSGEYLRTFSDQAWMMVESLCLGTDGRFALSGGWDGRLKLWDVGSGKCLRTFSRHT